MDYSQNVNGNSKTDCDGALDFSRNDQQGIVYNQSAIIQSGVTSQSGVYSNHNLAQPPPPQQTLPPHSASSQQVLHHQHSAILPIQPPQPPLTQHVPVVTLPQTSAVMSDIYAPNLVTSASASVAASMYTNHNSSVPLSAAGDRAIYRQPPPQQSSESIVSQASADVSAPQGMAQPAQPEVYPPFVESSSMTGQSVLLLQNAAESAGSIPQAYYHEDSNVINPDMSIPQSCVVQQENGSTIPTQIAASRTSAQETQAQNSIDKPLTSSSSLDHRTNIEDQQIASREQLVPKRDNAFLSHDGREMRREEPGNEHQNIDDAQHLPEQGVQQPLGESYTNIESLEDGRNAHFHNSSMPEGGLMHMEPRLHDKSSQRFKQAIEILADHASARLEAISDERTEGDVSMHSEADVREYTTEEIVARTMNDLLDRVVRQAEGVYENEEGDREPVFGDSDVDEVGDGKAPVVVMGNDADPDFIRSLELSRVVSSIEDISTHAMVRVKHEPDSDGIASDGTDVYMDDEHTPEPIDIQPIKRKRGRPRKGEKRPPKPVRVPKRSKRVKLSSTLDPNKTYYGCNLCEEQFNSLYVLRDHLETHVITKRLRCTQCNRTFNQFNSLKYHVRLNHLEPNDMVQCSICNKSFNRQAALDRHMVLHTGTSDYTCSFCKKSFGNKYHLKRHMAIHTGNKTFQCLHCDKKYAEKYQLRDHMKKNHPDLPMSGILQCHVPKVKRAKPLLDDDEDGGNLENPDGDANASFMQTSNNDEDEYDLAEGIVTDLEKSPREEIVRSGPVGPNQCEVCYKKFANSKHMKRHMMLHSGERPFKCDACDKAYDRKYRLREHYLREHVATEDDLPESLKRRVVISIVKKEKDEDGEGTAVQREKKSPGERERHMCDECGKVFARRYGLRRHIIAAHTPDKHVKCPICDKKFSRSDHLAKHVLTHTREKKPRPERSGEANDKGDDENTAYTCEVCGKTYKTMHQLKHHQVLHTGVRKHLCQQCGKSFFYSTSLKSHLRTHSEDRNYKCEECGSLFKSPYNLRVHLAIHKGKRYPCTHCNAVFRRSDSLARHMKRVTGTGVHKCPVCDKVFTRPYELNCHMPIHTGIMNHKCGYCGKGFARADNLRDHIFTHTRIGPTCQYCGKVFTNKYRLNKHINTHLNHLGGPSSSNQNVTPPPSAHHHVTPPPPNVPVAAPQVPSHPPPQVVSPQAPHHPIVHHHPPASVHIPAPAHMHIPHHAQIPHFHPSLGM